MTNGFKLLIDTNVVIGLEDAQPVQSSWAELVRLSSANNVSLYVDGANYDDVSRDKDRRRRAITLSKLDKFPRLRDFPIPSREELERRFGAIAGENDRTDVRLLLALETKAVGFLITQDVGLHRRAERSGLAASVLTVNEALEWLKRTFQKKEVILPFIEERKAYEIDRSDSIFVSLEADYDDFSIWFDKCCREHRDCWVLQVDGKIAGIVIRKDELPSDAPTRHRGPKILKVCTFKVRDEFRGEKFGELLLKQILWFGQKNRFNVVYLTVFPKQAFLIDLLSYYGFERTSVLPNGELVMEKAIINGVLPNIAQNIFEYDRLHYPRFYDGARVGKFCVPIRPDYHKALFPEVDTEIDLPLFPRSEFGSMLDSRKARTPGNTIRKVYLCRARTNQIRPGDLIFFYVSKDEKHVASQSITTLGVVEQVVDVDTTEDLIRLTAKRSVFSPRDLQAWNATPDSPVKVIDFLLVGHSDPPVSLDQLLADGIFLKHPPQSIARFDDRYPILRSRLELGFEF